MGQSLQILILLFPGLIAKEITILYIPDNINGTKATPYEYYVWQLKNDLKYGGRCK